MESYETFTRPVVADGKIFVCSQSPLYIYGLLHHEQFVKAQANWAAVAVFLARSGHGSWRGVHQQGNDQQEHSTAQLTLPHKTSHCFVLSQDIGSWRSQHHLLPIGRDDHMGSHLC